MAPRSRVTRRTLAGACSRRILAAGVLVPLLAVTGCATAADKIPENRSPAKPTAQQKALLEKAAQVLIGRCMRAHGFQYFLATAPSAAPDERTFPYGIDDVSWARKHGFGRPPERDTPRSQHASPNARYAANLPEGRQQAYLTALYGTEDESVSVTLPTGYTVSQSTNGCLASAQRYLYGDFSRWFRAKTIVNNLAAEIQPKVRNDARYLRALDSWATCMRHSGHPAASPSTLRARFVTRSERMDAGETRHLERELAVAEARCMRRTELAEIAHFLDRLYTAKVRKLRRTHIHAVRAMRTAALGRAREVTAARHRPRSSSSFEPSHERHVARHPRP